MGGSTGLAALPYAGSKSVRSNTGVGRWVHGHLAPTVNYCEPFFGMGGQLLMRPKRGKELVNDFSGRVTNWWTVIRDDTDRFWERLRMSSATSPFQLGWAVDHMDDGGIDGAVAFTTVLLCGFSEAKPDYRLSMGTRCPEEERVYALADRMRDVVVYNLDAAVFLEKFVDRNYRGGMLFYLDPPYLSSGASRFYNPDYDQQRVAELILGSPHKVAVSGYEGDGWDGLLPGWRKETKEVFIGVNASAVKEKKTRLECLWLNY